MNFAVPPPPENILQQFIRQLDEWASYIEVPHPLFLVLTGCVFLATVRDMLVFLVIWGGWVSFVVVVLNCKRYAKWLLALRPSAASGNDSTKMQKSSQSQKS